MITIIADIDAVRIRYWFNLSEMIELSTWRDFLNGRAAIATVDMARSTGVVFTNVLRSGRRCCCVLESRTVKNLVQIAGEPALMIVPHKSAMYTPHHCPGMEKRRVAAMTDNAASSGIENPSWNTPVRNATNIIRQ